MRCPSGAAAPQPSAGRDTTCSRRGSGGRASRSGHACPRAPSGPRPRTGRERHARSSPPDGCPCGYTAARTRLLPTARLPRRRRFSAAPADCSPRRYRRPAAPERPRASPRPSAWSSPPPARRRSGCPPHPGPAPRQAAAVSPCPRPCLPCSAGALASVSRWPSPRPWPAPGSPPSPGRRPGRESSPATCPCLRSTSPAWRSGRSAPAGRPGPRS
mmetsp:Transcript_92240/g.288664  ORF Transcript_92240/g.288664 Transcript_92240/m.288664 type:complete len:215 (-) Transcript_92240:1290-1934(-)